MVCVEPAPTPRVGKAQCTTPAVSVQPSTKPVIDQLEPGKFGSVSSRVTLLATPGPLFVTVMVKPIVSPALTGEASATFVTTISGQLTVIDAVALLLPVPAGSLAAAVVAVFSIVLHDSPVVVEMICTDFEAVGARSPKVQVS